MSNLLQYLVERSVLARPAPAPVEDGEMAGARPAPGGSETERPGVLRPRLSSRYERRPGAADWPGAPLGLESAEESDTRPWPGRSPVVEEPDGLAAPGRSVARRPEPPPSEPPPPPERSDGAGRGRPAIERRDRPAAPPGPTPPEPAGGLPIRRADRPIQELRAEAKRPAAPPPDPTDPAPPIQPAAVVEAPEIESRRESASADAGVARPDPATRGQMPTVWSLTRRPPASEPVQPRPGGIIPVPTSAPSRGPTRPVEANRPGSAAAPPLPHVQVSIGRVEVRAVFAPPPAPAPPRPRSGPALSLDDYLKQRDGSS